MLSWHRRSTHLSEHVFTNTVLRSFSAFTRRLQQPTRLLRGSGSWYIPCLPPANDAEQQSPAAQDPVPVQSTVRRRSQPSRRQQQQEQLWGTALLTPQPQASQEAPGRQPQQIDPDAAPSITSPPSLQPSRRRQQEMLREPFPPPGPSSETVQQGPLEPREQYIQDSGGDDMGMRSGFIEPGGGPSRRRGNISRSNGGDSLVPTDLMAQQDAALLMGSGRHRRRQPVATPSLPSLETPAPASQHLPSAVPQHDGGGQVVPTGAGSSKRTRSHVWQQPQNVKTGEAIGLKHLDGTGDPDDVNLPSEAGRGGGGGEGAGGGRRPSRRPVVLRLRRPEPPVPAARRIRLPLSQRPQLWPVKVLLEAQQQPDGEVGGEQEEEAAEAGWLGQAVGREQLDQLLRRDGGGAAEESVAEDVGGDVAPRGQIPDIEGGRGRGAGSKLRGATGRGQRGDAGQQLSEPRQQQQGQQQGQTQHREVQLPQGQTREGIRGPRTGLEDTQQAAAAAGALPAVQGRPLAGAQSGRPAGRQQQQQRVQGGGVLQGQQGEGKGQHAALGQDPVWGGRRDPQRHGRGAPGLQRTVESPAMDVTQRSLNLKQESQRKRTQRQQEEEEQSAAAAQGCDDAEVVAAAAVAAHPDGTLWSYRSRDVGPLALRVLQQLQTTAAGWAAETRQGEEEVEEGDVDGGSIGQGGVQAGAVPSGCLGNATGGNVEVSSPVIGGSSSSITGAVGASGSGGSGAAGSCHVLVAGSYQSYNLLRALSCVQGALRLAAYNSNTSSITTTSSNVAGGTPAGAALSFTATDVPPAELRSYFEQTLRSGTGSPPELGPPTPPPPGPKRALKLQRKSKGKGKGQPNRQGNGQDEGAAGEGAAEAAPPPLPAAPGLKGWPTDLTSLESSGLVSVFLVQPPPEMYGGGGTAAGPPVSVTTLADVGSLGRVAVAQLRSYGGCRLQALGRTAASRALQVVSRVAGTLSREGLGVVAFPYMTALGPQPRAHLPLPPRPPSSPPPRTRVNVGRRGGVGDAPRTPTTAAAAAAAAAAAFVDPVLLDKAPQLVLQLSLCEWDEAGRPRVLGRSEAVAVANRSGGWTQLPVAIAPTPSPGPAPPPDATAAAAVATAAAAAALSPPQLAGSGAKAPVAAKRSSDAGTAAGAAAAGGTGPRGTAPSGVRLRVPVYDGPAQVCLQLDGATKQDVRTVATAVATAVSGGQRVRLAACRLGALLRLPVVMFRAQGLLSQVERPGRSALVFTLRAEDKESAGQEEGEEAAVGEGFPSSQDGRRSGEQVRAPQPQQPGPWRRGRRGGADPEGAAGPGATPGRLPGPGLGARAAAAAEAEEAAPGSRGARAGSGDLLVAEVLRVPVSALQYHLDSLPGTPPPYIVTRSANSRLFPDHHHQHDQDDEGEDEDEAVDADKDEEDVGVGRPRAGGVHDGAGVRDGDDGGGNQRHVQAAAAAAASDLLRYGSAALFGSRPGRRVTALLAAAAVSDALSRSGLLVGGLTVLVRVDSRVWSAEPVAVPAAVPAAAGSAPAATVFRLPPPRRYQLLLARWDRRGGRLQLLRPSDLAALREAALRQRQQPQQSQRPQQPGMARSSRE